MQKAESVSSDVSPVVEISGLTKQFGEFVALKDLSLTLNKGSILGFIGPNGAGKTTAIRVLVGLTRPTSGTAHIAGADCVREARKVRQLVGYMPDKFGSYDNMRVREYLDFFGAAFGIARKKRQLRVAEVLEITNATWMQDRFVESLSHGMQQRIGLARTLLHDPEVLILDEPANGLDPQARIEMRTILLRLADEGRTLIVTSHILPELARICDRVAILAGGQLKAFGTLQEVSRTLSQRRTMEIELLNADRVEAVAAELRSSMEEDCEVTPSKAESVVRFRTSGADDQLAGLLHKLIVSGEQISQFREVAGDLEEIFISVTQQASQENMVTAESTPVAEAAS
ncbi:MAG: ABC transporter ATP-binding protein [Fuerstiella sp.]|nr:ABC transporter ATP-binding protein [Fuerstiella sp.]MCP4787555.1 ABC transporter ATP-binding protein [Fuerstiella sp.]MCP4858834.1 ABC transporter ATP-binding protein [Fuerstiella sp.]